MTKVLQLGVRASTISIALTVLAALFVAGCGDATQLQPDVATKLAKTITPTTEPTITPIPSRTPVPPPTKVRATSTFSECVGLLGPGEDPSDCIPYHDLDIIEEELWTDEEFCERVWYPGIEKDLELERCKEYWSNPDFGTGNTTACPTGCAERKPGCDIKGNISIDGGEKIYHLPGDKYYKRTKISPRYGERWFCTRAEAEVNGWRHARR